MLITPGSLASFNDVPTTIPPVAPGIYLLQVDEAKVEANKDQDGQNLVIQCHIAGGINGIESPQVGRKMRRYMSLPKPTDDQDTQKFKLMSIKQLFTGCGISEADGGFDTNKLVGARFNAEVSNRTYKDSGGADRESSDINRVLKTDGSRF